MLNFTDFSSIFEVRQSVVCLVCILHTVTNVAANNNGTEEAAIQTLQPNQLTRVNARVVCNIDPTLQDTWL